MHNKQDFECALTLCSLARNGKNSYKVFPEYGIVIGPHGHQLGKQKGYKIISLYGNTYYLHRFIWEYCFGKIPFKGEIDHIDRNIHNNCIYNLRLVTKSQQMRNRIFNKKKN